MPTIKEKLIANCEMGVVKPKSNGGQSIGIIHSPVYLKSEETEFYIKVGFHKSQYKNIQLAKTLFELYLDETIKV